MVFVRRLSPLLILCPLLVIPSHVFAAKARAKSKEAAPAATSPAYKGAVIMDAATGNFLFEDRADEVSPPASMTKLMTFAVLHDKIASGALSVSTPVKIEPEDARMGGTQVFLDPRETFPVEELLYAMMIQSANDAAHALARASAGSAEAFVDLMNAKARALGMTHTTFRSPHGLPPSNRKIADGDLTTPRDFAILCRHLLLKTDVLKYSSVRTRDFGTARVKGPQHMKNHNNLLGRVSGVDGLKTGYTEGAGYCLSATAERNHRRVIVVVMGSFGPKGEKDLGKARDKEAIKLIERGFSALPSGGPEFKPETAAASSTPMTSISVAPMSPEEKKDATANGEPVIKFAVPPKKK